mmetsp:Transcript_23858/g.41893  ORF Transcript_23858/g.41893 Transcript_23858/m.41893 type:complete len:713 (-) Transcript_23858:113-2251(-)
MGRQKRSWLWQGRNQKHGPKSPGMEDTASQTCDMTNLKTTGKLDSSNKPRRRRRGLPFLRFHRGQKRKEDERIPAAVGGPEKENSNHPLALDTKVDDKTPTQPLSSNANASTASSKRTSFLRRLSSPILMQRFNSDKESRSSKDTAEESHGFQSDDEHHPLHSNNSMTNMVMKRTTVVPASFSPPRKIREESLSPPTSPMVEPVDDDDAETYQASKFECATAILQHSYLERMCGVGGTESFDDLGHSRSRKRPIPEDPTVQESIECIFASQLEGGLELWDEDEEDVQSELETVSERSSDLVSPADLLQSRLNRNDRKNSSSFSMTQTKKRYEQASLVYVGTFDPTIDHEEVMKNMVIAADGHPDPLPCPCASSFLPALEPKDWSQAPVLLRPTPGSGTRVKAIRFCNSQEPLWVPGSHLSWSERLARHWGKPCEEQPHFACCECCAALPVNNGNEEPGHALVIDFESELFEGSFLLRLRFAEGTTPEPYDDNKGYFKGVNRRYQAIFRGRFKKSIPFTEMVTGFKCDRKFGKLPAKWVLRSGLKVISFFAPQLDAKLEGEKPHSLTPLGSTPQSIAVDDPDEVDELEGARAEPTEDHRCLLGRSSDAPTSLQRAKVRKKAFDKLFVQQSSEPRADTSKVYTFEFLQHLFNFQTFSVELGNMLGSVELEEILDGQPLQIMAAAGDEPLWSFDVWHECLWQQAKAHEEQRCRKQ